MQSDGNSMRLIVARSLVCELLISLWGEGAPLYIPCTYRSNNLGTRESSLGQGTRNVSIEMKWLWWIEASDSLTLMSLLSVRMRF